VCACPVTGIIVVGNLGIRGIVVISPVTVINSGLAESESGGTVGKPIFVSLTSYVGLDGRVKWVWSR